MSMKTKTKTKTKKLLMIMICAFTRLFPVCLLCFFPGEGSRAALSDRY